jgi:hypothetical protein
MASIRETIEREVKGWPAVARVQGPLARLDARERRTFRKLLTRVRSNLGPGFEAEQ